MANNADWLNTLNYIDFLRDVGRHFSVNRMLTFDSVKLRLERQHELSFLEFNYMILQAYDFVELYKRTGCVLQMGGSDQWGNIVNGIDLGRRLANAQLFALTAPLLTTSSGAKMGKTAAGAVWLNADMVSPYDYWQYWRNTEDGDVAPLPEAVHRAAARRDRPPRAVEGPGDQRGQEGARHRGDRAGAWPRRGGAGRRAPRRRRSRKAGCRRACRRSRLRAARSRQASACSTAFVRAGLVASNGEARRQIKAGGLKVNDTTVTDEKMMLDQRPSHRRRRDQAVARQEAARAAQAGVSISMRGAGLRGA